MNSLMQMLFNTYDNDNDNIIHNIINYTANATDNSDKSKFINSLKMIFKNLYDNKDKNNIVNTYTDTNFNQTYKASYPNDEYIVIKTFYDEYYRYCYPGIDLNRQQDPTELFLCISKKFEEIKESMFNFNQFKVTHTETNWCNITSTPTASDISKNEDYTSITLKHDNTNALLSTIIQNNQNPEQLETQTGTCTNPNKSYKQIKYTSSSKYLILNLNRLVNGEFKRQLDSQGNQVYMKNADGTILVDSAGNQRPAWIQPNNIKYEYIVGFENIITIKQSDNSTKTYEFQGCIVHMGSFSGGHYIYYKLINDKYVKYSDSNVSQEAEIPWKRELEQNGVVYLYKLTDAPKKPVQSTQPKPHAEPATVNIIIEKQILEKKQKNDETKKLLQTELTRKLNEERKPSTLTIHETIPAAPSKPTSKQILDDGLNILNFITHAYNQQLTFNSDSIVEKSIHLNMIEYSDNSKFDPNNPYFDFTIFQNALQLAHIQFIDWYIYTNYDTSKKDLLELFDPAKGKYYYDYSILIQTGDKWTACNVKYNGNTATAKFNDNITSTFTRNDHEQFKTFIDKIIEKISGENSKNNDSNSGGRTYAGGGGLDKVIYIFQYSPDTVKYDADGNHVVENSIVNKLVVDNSSDVKLITKTNSVNTIPIIPFESTELTEINKLITNKTLNVKRQTYITNQSYLTNIKPYINQISK